MRNPILFTGNRVENLIEALTNVLRRSLSTPFHPEVIVVQSKGMERYLSMQIAERLGIWANCRYLFPNGLVAELFGKVFPDLPNESPFDPDPLAWRIMKALPSMVSRPGFESLKNYLEGEEKDLKRLQLSASIADVFDQYLLFRPDMIFRWEKGEEEHWQAELWRQLNKGGLEGYHRAALAHRFLRRLQNPSLKEVSFPERISVFGISALPRFHMEILAAVSRYSEVNLFLMNPCQEYWGDLFSGDTGLLSSLGRLGRDFMDMVIDLGWEESSFFDDPGNDSLLHTIQSDILHLKEAQGNGDERVVSNDDRSIQIHVCHSPLREVEVLRDQILHMLEADPALNPGEILVMTPEIGTHAPFIQAVFDVPSSDPSWIPFSIADQGFRDESRVVEPFLAILDLAGSRFKASQVLSILEFESVSRKFGLGERELELVRRWVKEAGIRWGIDEKEREDAGLPAFCENTWRAGLDRLLLGYAMPGGEERMFRDILPYDHLEGSDATLLGRLMEFVELLFGRVKLLEGRRKLEEWSAILLDGIEEFFDADLETGKEMQLLRQTVADLAKRTSLDADGYDEPIDLKSVRWHLGRILKREGLGYGFLTGGITFCAMLPMRSIPFKVICMIGMDHDAYPRKSHGPGFDLISRDPKPGDRSRRNDDRYLFLEALLSAREKLYISYVGRSIQDNSTIPPSVLVSELLDHIEQGFRMQAGEISDHLLLVHGLQPFSPRYFMDGEKFFSYSEENCAAAMNLTQARQAPTPFIGAGLSEPEEEYKVVDVAQLCTFYSNPTRYLLQNRLGLYLEEHPLFQEDREPLEIKGLEKYRLEQTMVKKSLEGLDLGDLFPVLRASGAIPPGAIGECEYEDIRRGVERFTDQAAQHVRTESLEPLALNHRIGPFRLVGRIEGIYRAELVRYRYAIIRGADFLKTWIIHLVLNSVAPREYPRITRLIGLAEKGEDCLHCRFSQVENGGDSLLKGLLERYWSGMRNPLHFFPESSWTYAWSLVMQGKDPKEALRRSRKIWSGSEWGRGECEDDYYRMCFRDADPLDESFEEASMGVLDPLLGHLEIGCGPTHSIEEAEHAV